MISDFVTTLIDKYAVDPRQKEILSVHSSMVASKACRIAVLKGLDGVIDMQFLEDAAMLHDIGIVGVNAPSIHCYGSLPYICHGLEGARILKEEGIAEKYQRVCARHTGAGITVEDIVREKLPLPVANYCPETLEERLICYADKFFSKSRDLRYEKTSEEIERSMVKFGEATLERYRILRAEFD